jgi:pyruvate dehydrogenase E2 component (dihydrolipoamide acetyltransferase)
MMPAQASQARAGRRFASPLSRAMARREGLDLERVAGSGPLGRIVKADVLAALDTGACGSGLAGPAFEEISNSISRKLLARRLTESKQQAPHVYLRMDCDIGTVLRLRADAAGQDAVEGRKLSINDFVIKAAALALKDWPAVNASFTDTAIRRYRQINIAVAVALEDGLLTPVIEDADRKSVSQIAAEMRNLAARARAGPLAHGASRGGTFSISNLGGYGVREFTAVINPPQAAILAVGAAEPRPVVRDDKLTVATMMTVTLSVDHRAIDGALAARWLAAFRKHLENPQAHDVWKSSLHAP